MAACWHWMNEWSGLLIEWEVERLLNQPSV